MQHVFLSYSRSDKDLMRRMREDLTKAGLTVWTDEGGLVPGTPTWETAVAKAIEDAVCVVVILSPDAKQSSWVGREISYAEEHGVRIVPVLASGDSQESVPLRLISWQHLDARTDYAGAIAAIAETVKTGAAPAAATSSKRRKRRSSALLGALAVVAVVAGAVVWKTEILAPAPTPTPVAAASAAPTPEDPGYLAETYLDLKKACRKADPAMSKDECIRSKKKLDERYKRAGMDPEPDFD